MPENTTTTLYARLALPRTKKGRAKYAGSVYIEREQKDGSVLLNDAQCEQIRKLAKGSDAAYRRAGRSPYRENALKSGSLRVGLTSHNGVEIASAAGVYADA